MKLETIYLVHHSHTDIGYTHDQPVVWEAQRRFLDTALDACEQDLDHEGDHAFRWTVETTGVLAHWLRHATPRHVERLVRLVEAGRVEVTGMFANLTPLFDTDQLVETLQLVGRLRRELGLTIRHAMNCDVNGHNWPLVDVLLDAGIEAFSMAINEHFGGAPLDRPNVFWWEGPSGRRILALNGWHYMTGNMIGIGRDAEDVRERWLPAVEARLQEVGWPFPFVMIQITHPFGDNGSANFHLREFVRQWNETVERPRIRLATPAEWWEAVRAYVRQHGIELPVHRGDWTDYWNFGCISSAREQAINRASRARLVAADQLMAFLDGMGVGPAGVAGAPGPTQARSEDGRGPAGADLPGRGPQTVWARVAELRQQAWEALHLWDEHTWGADVSVRQPENEDTYAQWYHKARYAYEARSLSLMLARDAAAELALRVPRAEGDALLLYNPLPWARVVAGPVSGRLVQPRGLGDDPAASRHHQDRVDAAPTWFLKPVEVPGCGYVVVGRGQLVQAEQGAHYSEAAVVENEWHRLTFDRERGGIVSWVDKRLGQELVDGAAGLPLAGPVHEQVADRRHPWPRHLLWQGRGARYQMQPPRGWKPDWRAERRGPARVLAHRVRQTPVGLEVVQELEVPGLAGPATLRVQLPDHAPYVEFSASWLMGTEAHPEATYLAFPFAVPGAVARLDLGGQAMRPEVDQIPGCCRDYFTVQRWVDFSNDEWGVTVACPDNPMVQLGDFTFGRNQSRFELQRALLLGWVTNNYWETNFRAYQPGQVQARYVVLPHVGPFDEAAAHRFGLEVACPPLYQSAFEPARPEASLPRQGSWLSLPQPPVLVLHVGPIWADGTGSPGHSAASSSPLVGGVRLYLWIRLLNASNEEQIAEIGPDLLAVTDAAICDLFGQPSQPVPLQAGRLYVPMPPRVLRVVRLEVETRG